MKKDKELLGKVEEVLEGMRGGIEAHGGGVRVESIKKGMIRLKILGACIGCPMAQITFGEGVAAELKKIKGVRKVEFE